MATKSPEQELILLLSRLHPEEGVIRAAERLIADSSGGLDYGKLFELALKNGVAMLLYDNLKNVPATPSDFMSRLENLFFQTYRRNVFHLKETTKILQMLITNDIEVIPLKGAIAADTIFENLGLYPTSDIDILIREKDLDLAEELLASAGYKKTMDLNRKDLFDASYHVCYGNGTSVVEVHWNLVMRYYNVEPAFWWQETVKKEYEGLSITLLSPERYILYAIFRLFCHAFVPLRFSAFVSALIHANPKIDWDKLMAYSEKLKMKRLTIFSLRLMDDLHGTEIPASISDHKILVYGWLYRFIVSGFSIEVKRSPRMLVFTSLLLDSPAAIARVVLRRIFPGMGEIRWRYGLSSDSKTAYLYYLLNPFILMLRRR